MNAAPRITLNAEGLRARHRAVRRAMPADALSALRALVRPVLAGAVNTSPSDTGRYRRAWVQAMHAVGIGGIPVPTLRPSRFAQRVEERLEQDTFYFARRVKSARKNADFWLGIMETRYWGAKPRPRLRGRWYREALNAWKAAEKEAVRAEADLQAAENALRTYRAARASNGAGGAVGATPVVFWGRRRVRGGRAPARVSAGIGAAGRLGGGGDGRAWANEAGASIRAVNREPHAAIVESRSRTLAGAMRAMRAAGLRQAKARLGRALAAGGVGGRGR